MVFTAGLCRTALRVLGMVTKSMRVKVLTMLMFLLYSLSEPLCPAAMAVLVAGDVVELIVGDMAEDGEVIHYVGGSLLRLLCADQAAGNRMCAPGTIHTLVKWMARWMLKVRDLVVLWGKLT